MMKALAIVLALAATAHADAIVAPTGWSVSKTTSPAQVAHFGGAASVRRRDTLHASRGRHHARRHADRGDRAERRAGGVAQQARRVRGCRTSRQPRRQRGPGARQARAHRRGEQARRGDARVSRRRRRHQLAARDRGIGHAARRRDRRVHLAKGHRRGAVPARARDTGSRHRTGRSRRTGARRPGRGAAARATGISDDERDAHAPLPPMAVPPPPPSEADRRPLFVGTGIVLLAGLFWWNTRRRARLENEEDPDDR